MNISKNQEALLNEILADGKVTVNDFQLMRDKADAEFNKVVDVFGRHNDFTAFQKSADVTVQLMQNIILDLNRTKLSDTGKAIIVNAMIAQINYIAISTDFCLEHL